MLQWMGGSRRKVATSRNSTHKRQRQYFEQRKRQQQVAGSEGYIEGKPSASQNFENNRSLDILGLVNVSSIAQEHENISLNARDNSNDDDGSTFHHQYTYQSPSSQAGRDTVVNPSESNQETSGTSTSHHSDTGSSKKVLVRLTDPKEHLVRNGNKFDHSMSPAQQMSVMDLLGDGGANSNAEESSVHVQEAHVAFSVQGLGEVKSETPVQPPKTSGRFFSKGYSSPKKSWKQPTASKHLDYSFDDIGFQMDVMMQDSEKFSPYATSRNYPFCSTDEVNRIGDPNPKFLNFRTSSPFYWNGSDLKGVFSKDELFSNGPENGRIIWNDPSFLDADVDALGEYESFCNSRADPGDVGFNDHFNCENYWKKDFNFEDWNLQNKWFSIKQNEGFDNADMRLPYPKSKLPEHYPDFKISDTRYTTIQIDDEDRDNSTSFASENTRDMSRLSQESCSSTAVRGDAPRNLEKTTLE